MLLVSIYITEDFGVFFLNFGKMSAAAPDTHNQVKEDFRENPEISSMSSNRQPKTPSFGAFRRNNLPSSSTNGTRRKSLEMQFIL